MRFGHTYLPPAPKRFSRPYKCTDQNLAAVQLNHTSYSYAASAVDLIRYYIEFQLEGSETVLELGTVKDTNKGKFDIYVNGVLDSSAYDEYNAGGSLNSARAITLTVPIVPGHNTIEIRVNGKNAASSGYQVVIFGASLR